MSSIRQTNVNWFRDAAPYINQHRGKTFVVCFSGDAVNSKGFDALIHDLALLDTLGIRLVLVAGARPQIADRLALEQIPSEYANGLRITNEDALNAVIEAVGRVRVLIEARLSLSLINTPMSGSEIKVSSGNFITARPMGIINGVDFGHTGKVRKVAVDAISRQLEIGQCVLLSPLGYSPTGEVFNLRAEEVATACASALAADKLILFSDSQKNKEQEPWPLAPQLTASQLDERLLDSIDNPELRMHLENAREALLRGVQRCHILDRNIDGGLLKELFTRDGAGTLISDDNYEGLRRANINDVAGILELIAPLEDKQALVRRSREQLELEIDYFTIIERDGVIIGCAALYPYRQDNVGELACLAINPDYHGEGRGDLLLAEIERQALEQGLSRLFVLSTQTMHWFIEHGFKEGDLDALPVEKAKLYNYQRRAKVFIKPL
ncbi:MAG: amino-acid N-acetyltransferase [bacterium]